MNTLLAAALDLVFPESCVCCGRAGSLLCDRCAQAVVPLPRPVCLRCGQPDVQHPLCARCIAAVDDPIAMARAAALHEEPLRSAIHALKYENHPGLAALLYRYLVAALDHEDWKTILPRIDAVCPVPLHPARVTQRGYNQSALLAEPLAAVFGWPYQGEWLVRHRDTPPQVGLSASDRLLNVANSFAAVKPLPGATILLVDDVYTTGATLRACAVAARQAGAADLFAVTLARPRLPASDSDAKTV